MRLPLRYSSAPLSLLALGCGPPAAGETPSPRTPSPDTLEVTMRAPAEPYRMGPQRPEWTGRAVVTGTTLEFDFPAVEADNVGCAAVDSLASSGPAPLLLDGHGSVPRFALPAQSLSAGRIGLCTGSEDAADQGAA